jgi:hypothetical protein
MLAALLLAAAPFPMPTPLALERCDRAACSTATKTRVCKCVRPTEAGDDLLIVDRSDERRVVITTSDHLGEVTDFRAQFVELDGDGAPELVIASMMGESNGMGIRTWHVAIVDGKDDVAVHFVTHDFGLDALKSGSVLVTEWAWEGLEKGNALFFIGRDYAYAAGELKPTKAPVLRRRYTAEFEKERGAAVDASPDRLLPGRQFLSHPSTTKSADEPPTLHRLGTVKAVTQDDPEYAVHAEDEKGQLAAFSSDGEEGALVRIGDFKSRRLFPLRYWPHGLEQKLIGKPVLMGLRDGQPNGVLFVQGSLHQ